MLEQDERLGLIGGDDTKICAVCEQAVSSGMITRRLHEGYYFRVHPKCQRRLADEHIFWLSTLVPIEAPDEVEEQEFDDDN